MNQPQPTISTQIVRHIRDCLELAGVPAATLLAEHGVAPECVDERNASIPLGDYVRFFEAAAIASGNPHFGMHAARVMSADGLGPLSFLFLSAPTLRQAFQSFSEYLDAMQEATFNAVVHSGPTCHFTYGIADSGISPRRQDSEYSMGVMCNLMSQYLGVRSAISEVHFEHERAGSLSWYESYFDCPVFFEQPHNRLYFSAALLDRGSSALSTELFPIIVGHLRERMHGAGAVPGITQQVRDLLFAHPPDELPDLNRAAAHLGCSRATLKRRLAAAGPSFTDLINERRIGYAQQLLASSQRDIADVALACGFAETASFSRAFRRHVGETPSRWRGANRRKDRGAQK